MSATGLLKSRLERMHRLLSGYIERGETPGLVARVSHHDVVHAEMLGVQSVGVPTPMNAAVVHEVQRHGVGRLQPDPRNLEPLAALLPTPASTRAGSHP